MAKKKIEASIEAVENKTVEAVEVAPVVEAVPVVENAQPVAEKEMHYVTVCDVNARNLPSIQGKVLYALKPLEEVAVIGEINGWYQISSDAFVMKQYIEKVEK